jgi:predicted RNA methylase
VGKWQKVNSQVSDATKRNWEKLGVKSTDGKLVSRANKRLSTKRITPVEYFDSKSNIKIFEEIADDLSREYESVGDVIYTIGVKLLQQNGSLDELRNSLNPTIQNFVNSCNYTYIEPINIGKFPKDETDLLGLIYQCLLQEGEKNTQGSYYTPKSVVLDMVGDIKLGAKQTVLDPCCGSLVYLLNIPNIKPEQIYAVDNDPVAVMIAKFNYFLRFPNAKVVNIFTDDFLSPSNTHLDVKFDFVVTNPPWGASTKNTHRYPEIKSGETFSCFLVQAHKSLKRTGQLRFLLPESILNVKTHRDIRDYILHKADLLSIKMYADLFSGVTTKYVAIKANYSGSTTEVEIDIADRSWGVEKVVYKSNPNYIFRLSDSTDESIIEKVLEEKRYDLSQSVWALGIVTGNNKEKLVANPAKGLEQIYTGKEIAPYKLKPSKYYINYDRSQLQQVAKDEIYRAKPKLVYKFISKKLVFAVDESASLFLNSANILVPNIPNMSVKSVSAFLNSELYQYLYMKLFREIKILKGNLLQLPFPEIDSKTDKIISSMVDEVISGKTDDKKLQDFVYDYYKISADEIKCIKKEVYGTAD